MASYNEIAKAYVTLLPTLKGAQNRITSELSGISDKAGKSAGKSAGAGIASGVVGSIKNVAIGNVLANAITSGASAVKTAVTSVMGGAFSGFSEYEQLAGGVETLFKSSADIVKAYSDQAYMTAGMDANQYLNTVTSFSASLITGLGGDTAKAADVANKAVVDMADNANKMGTPIESLQLAYQGFAKQQFGLLDNLKIGYGGSQAEMARLINDTGVMGDSFVATARNINEVPFDKIIEGIHIVQENLGIAGATGEEAMSTIEGSIKATKSAWDNWLTGLGRDDVDMSSLTENLTTSFEAAAKNVIPRIGIILGSAIKSAPELVASIKEVIPQLADEVFGAINEAAAGTSFEGIGDSLRTAFGVIHDVKHEVFHVLGEIYQGAKPIIEKVVEYLPGAIETAKGYIEQGMAFVADLWQKAQPYVDVVIEFIKNAIEFVKGAIDTASPIIADFFGKAQDGAGKAGEILQQVWQSIQPIVQALQENIPRIWDAIRPVLEAIGSFFMEWWSVLGSWIEQIGAIIMENLPGLSEMVASAIGAVTSALEFISPILTELINFLRDYVLPVVQVIGSAVIEVAGFLLGVVADAIKTVFDIVKGVFDFLKDIPGNIQKAFSTLGEIITAPFKNAFNAIAKFWNDTVGQLQWDVPDWVPGIGGQTVGAPKLPMLASGGIVTQATAAILGEAGPEKVIPLDSPSARQYDRPQGADGLTAEDIKQAIADGMAGFGFSIGDKQLAAATRSANDRVTGAARVYQRRGIAYA